jgi:integrase
VPDGIRPLLGKTEIVRSLRTSSLRIARPKAALLSALVMEAFDVIKENALTAAQAQRLVQQCFVQSVATAEARRPFAPATTYPDLEISEQESLSDERICSLLDQVTYQKFERDVLARVQDLLAQQGWSTDNLSEASMHNLAEGVARALVEEERHFQFRLRDRLSTYTPVDPIFKEAPAAGLQMAQDAPAPIGPNLGDSVNEYLAAFKNRWKLKTYKARAWQLGYLVEFVGADRPISSITKEDIRRYRNAVLSLRANHGFAPSQTFAQKRTDNKQARISPRTADLIFRPTKAFFKWAVTTDGLIDVNPADAVKIVMPLEPKGEKVRRPFTKHEIVTLFSSPTFTGCKSRHRRHDPGPKIIRDARFWLPVLGYYTGCRLGELIQLAIEDVRCEDGIHYLDINEKALIGSDQKSVKSKAGIRRVPLHPDLISLGFLTHVSKRRNLDKPNVRLFKEQPFGKDGQASTEYSKIFGRLMEKVGLTDKRLVFHSFRHGVEDALRDAETQPYIIDSVIGHADTSMGGKYGKGPSLAVLHQALVTMALPVNLTEILEKA